MLVYQTFATSLLEPNEAVHLYPALAVAPTSMTFALVEQAWQAANLQLLERDEIGSEWREWWEENGVNTTSKQLLQMARMRRDRACCR